MKVLAGLAAVAGLILVGLMLARPVNKGGKASEQPEPAQPVPAASAQPEPSASPSAPAVASSPPPEGSRPAAAATLGLITNWEDKVSEILTSDIGTDAQARQMLEIFPRLPEDGQVEVAKHLSNLVADQDYADLAQLLADPRLPTDVLDALMADLLNRPESLKLPTLLEIARNTEHPKAGDAKQTLGFLLDSDYGDDWAKWQDKVQQRLKENSE